MDTIEKLVAAAVANAVKDDIVANDKKDKAATSNTWHLDSRFVMRDKINPTTSSPIQDSPDESGQPDEDHCWS